MQGESSKFTAVHLVPVVYTSFSAQNQQELIEILGKVASDSVPQMRKQSHLVLNEMIKLCPKVPEKDLLNVFIKLQKDEQDSVRMHGVESCILFAQKLSPTMATTHLVPII